MLVVDSFAAFDFQHDSQRVYEGGLSEEIALAELRNTTVLTDVSTSSSIHKIHRRAQGLGAYDDFSWRKYDMLDETKKKLLDEEREHKREMCLRHSRRTLYPDKEEWIVCMAVDAFMEQEEENIDITKYKFYTFMPRTHCAHLSFGIHRFIRQLTIFRDWCAFGLCGKSLQVPCDAHEN